MVTLWLRASEEVTLPGVLNEEEQRRLLELFEGPAFARCLYLFKLPARKAPLLRFVNGVPYFSASELTRIVSHGLVEPVKGERGEVRYEPRKNFFSTLNLFRSQWRLEKFLAAGPELPPLEESMALGLAVQ